MSLKGFSFYLQFYLQLVVLSLIVGLLAAAQEEGRCRRGVVSCMKCDSNNTTRCAKCTQLVVLAPKCRSTPPAVLPTTQLHEGGTSAVSSSGSAASAVGGNGSKDEHVCPPGYTTSAHLNSLVDFMASVCKERLGVGGMSGEAVGATVGIVVCVVVALATLLYCKIKSNRRPPPSLTHSSQGCGSEESEWSGVEFVKQVSELRRDAPLFLAMLNDTRRQVRALTSHSALQPYKPVLKDLSRILILVNRCDERLGQPPPDWETLLAWAHRVLSRYKKHHPDQVNELVNFLSGGGSSDGLNFTGLVSGGGTPTTFDTNYNTKKTPRDYIHHRDFHQNQNRQHQFHHTTRYQPDDFFTLGFRPQDEITTEL